MADFEVESPLTSPTGAARPGLGAEQVRQTPPDTGGSESQTQSSAGQPGKLVDELVAVFGKDCVLENLPIPSPGVSTCR